MLIEDQQRLDNMAQQISELVARAAVSDAFFAAMRFFVAMRFLAAGAVFAATGRLVQPVVGGWFSPWWAAVSTRGAWAVQRALTLNVRALLMCRGATALPLCGPASSCRCAVHFRCLPAGAG